MKRWLNVHVPGIVSVDDGEIGKVSGFPIVKQMRPLTIVRMLPLFAGLRLVPRGNEERKKLK